MSQDMILSVYIRKDIPALTFNPQPSLFKEHGLYIRTMMKYYNNGIARIIID